MDAIRARIVAEAIEWQGTPYAHRQRCKGAGVDCVQFLLGVVVNCGFLTEAEATVEHYSTQWHLHQNEEVLLHTIERYQCVSKPLEARLPGDLLAFQFGRVVSHCAFYLGNNLIIHALFTPPHKVVVHNLDALWQKRLRRCYQLPWVLA